MARAGLGKAFRWAAKRWWPCWWPAGMCCSSDAPAGPGGCGPGPAAALH